MDDVDANEFWSNVDLPLPSWVCWMWLGATGGPHKRYGRFGRTDAAHRIAWNLSNPSNPAKDNEWVGHVCGHTKCVNPYHLVKGPPKMVLAATPGWRARRRRNTAGTAA